MKKILLTLLAAVSFLAANAELREDAFTVCTSNDELQGYLFGDVLKITFSNLDDDGLPHTGVYYQELHFADTIVRTPVQNIEAVSFPRPSIKYQPDVVLAAETGLFDYLRARDEFILTFDAQTPSDILPEVGQMLTYFDVDNDILGGTFAGRVLSIDSTDAGIVIATEQPDRIQDIFEELIGVEAIGDDSPGVQQCLRRAGALRRVGGSGSHSLNFDMPIGFEWSPGSSNEDDDDPYAWENPEGVTESGKKFSLTGGIRGSLDIRIVYEFSKTRDYLSVGTTYEYTPYFKFEFACEKSWEQVFMNPIANPVINIVAPSAPIFTIAFGATPFLKTNGAGKITFEKTFPTTKTRTLAYYLDGVYKSGSCNANDLSGEDNEGDYELSLTLEGSAMCGVDMGLYVGTTRTCKSTVGIFAEAYVGPKITGSIGVVPTMPSGKPGPNTVAYNQIKNWSVTMSLVSVELQLSYYREVLGKDKKTPFSNMAFDIDPHTLSFVPSFSAPNWKLPSKNSFDDWWMVSDIDAPVNISVGSPSGDSLIPINPGYALYDEDGKFLDSRYSSESYWLGTMNDKAFKNMNWNYSGWIPGKKYKLYPAFMMFGSEFRATPSRTVSIKGDVRTGEYEPGEGSQVYLTGYIDDEVMMCPEFKDLGFVVSRDPYTLESDGEYSWLGRWSHESEFHTALTLASNTTYYYAAVAQVGEEMIYGQVKNFTTGKRTFRGIDLHLPSGTIWCSVDIPSETGKESANFYTWESWISHPIYQEMVDDGWRLPTFEEIQELYDPNACRHTASDGTNTSADFYPLDGGEGISLYGGHYFGGANYYWSSTEIDEPVYEYDDEGNKHLKDTLHLAGVLYATYGYNYPTKIDRTVDHSGEMREEYPVNYRIRMVK